MNNRDIIIKALAFMLTLLCLTSKSWANGSESVSGKIYRISYEPVGIILSLQDGQGQVVKVTSGGCGNRELFLLSTKHDNFSSLKIAAFSAYHNQQHIQIELGDCKFALPQITKFGFSLTES